MRVQTTFFMRLCATKGDINTNDWECALLVRCFIAPKVRTSRPTRQEILLSIWYKRIYTLAFHYLALFQLIYFLRKIWMFVCIVIFNAITESAVKSFCDKGSTDSAGTKNLHSGRFFQYLVPKAGLEPARLTSLPPQDSVSTNSTTWALFIAVLNLKVCIFRRFFGGSCRHIGELKAIQRRNFL